MFRFKIGTKSIARFGNGRPGFEQREFRTWDARSVLVGVGVHGNISALGLQGQKLDDATGTLGQVKTGNFDSNQPLHGMAPASAALTGLGLSGAITGLTVWTVDVSLGITAASHVPVDHMNVSATIAAPMPPPNDNGTGGNGGGTGGTPPPPPPAGAIKFVIGDELTELTRMLETGYVATGFSTMVSKGWLEWGQIVHGADVSAEGLVETLAVSALSQRIEVTLKAGSSGPLAWYFSLDSSATTHMLLLGHVREAAFYNRTVKIAGVSWDRESSAELEAVTLLGA